MSSEVLRERWSIVAHRNIPSLIIQLLDMPLPRIASVGRELELSDFWRGRMSALNAEALREEHSISHADEYMSSGLEDSKPTGGMFIDGCLS